MAGAVDLEAQRAQVSPYVATSRRGTDSRDTVNINEKRDGLDFFYTERNNAIKMCDFLASVVPVR